MKNPIKLFDKSFDKIIDLLDFEVSSRVIQNLPYGDNDSRTDFTIKIDISYLNWVEGWISRSGSVLFISSGLDMKFIGVSLETFRCEGSFILIGFICIGCDIGEFPELKPIHRERKINQILY